MNDLGKILVTTDFSDCSLLAFEPALMLARKFEAELIVVHVDDDRFPPLMVEYVAVSMEDLRKHQHTHSRDQLRAFVAKHGDSDVPTRLEVPLGVPHAEIVRLAEELGVDLIVMATHGRGFMSHAIMGSTTERVLRRAPCPVLAVRDPGDR